MASRSPDWPRIPYDDGAAQIRLRQAGPAQPDRDAGGVSEHFARFGLQGLRQASWPTRRHRGLGDPGQDRRQPRLLRPHERLGARAGPAGPGLHLLAQGRGRGRGRPARFAKNIGPSAPRRSPAARVSATATPASSSPATRKSSTSSPGECAQQGRFRAGCRPRTLRAFAWIVDFPMFEWNEDEKKVDFAHNPFSMPQGGLEALVGDPLDRSRPTSTTWPATAMSLSPRAASATSRRRLMVKAFEKAGYVESPTVDRALRRHGTARSSTARRPTAAWRRASTASSCCSGRGDEPARGHHCSR
jgi:aspartyl-tRNA synthetase